MLENKARKFYVRDDQDAFLDRFLPGQRTAVIKKLLDDLMIRVKRHEAINGQKEWLNVDQIDSMK